MEARQDSMSDAEHNAAAPVELAAPLPARQMLPPKGACWYCDKPLDKVRRFCGKACSAAFDEEAQYTR